MAVVKWIGIVLGSFLLLLVLLLALLDWNWVGGYAARKLSDMSGRTLTIAGDVDIDWSWAPHIHVERIRLENAPWSSEPSMLELAALDFRIDLNALITGDVVLPEVTLTQPRVFLELSSEGEPNWAFRAKPVPEVAAKAAIPEERTEFPIIRWLRIAGGRVVYRDLAGDTDLTATLQINGDITHVGDTWKLDDFAATIAGSIVRGEIVVDTGNERPLIRADVIAETLDIQQLLDRLDHRPHAATAPSPGVAASGPTLDLRPLRAVDASINLRARHIIAPQLPLENVSLHAKLHDSQLRVQPLTLELQSGKIIADIQLDATGWPLHGTLKSTFQRLDLERIVQPIARTDQHLGVLDGELLIRVSSADATRAEADVMLPFVGQLVIENSQLSYTDPAQNTEISMVIDTEGLASDEQVVRIEGQGRYRGETFDLRFRGDPLLDLREPEDPYALDMTVNVAQTQAHLTGQLLDPLKLKGLDVRLEVAGPNPERLSPLLGLPLPSLPPYHVQGNLARQGNIWHFLDFAGRVGDSDLAGDIRVDIGGARPFVKADLTSRKVDFDDLGPLIGLAPDTGPEETASPVQQQEAVKEETSVSVLPKDVINFEHLRRLDASVTLRGKRIETKLPLDDLTMQVIIDAGRLTLAPLDFGVANGNVRSRIALDTNSQAVQGNVETEVRRVELNEILRRFDIADESVGIIGGRAKFWIQGDTVAEMLASADGGSLLLMTGGKLDDLLVELAGLDAGEALAALLSTRRGVEINCAFVDAPTTNGIMKLDTLVVDTDDTLFLGTGSIDFTQERLDLLIDPKPKDLSLFSARAPLHVQGSFKDPAFFPGTSALLRGAVSLALLPSAPIAALISLLEAEDDEENIHCSGLVDAINEARQSE